MDDLSIRPVRPEDLPEIVRLHDLAFGGQDEGRLVSLLHDRGQAVISLAALTSERIIGHILFSPVHFTPEHTEIRALGLAPLAVLPEFQNLGIGTRLTRDGLILCQAGGWQAVVVLGHPEYYPRFGFAPASRFGIGNEYGVDEPFMALELQPGCLAGVRAVACYAGEFKEIGV
jgi:putative acetyltransferase